MKLKKYIFGVALGALSLTYASCYNADHEFPDFEGGTTAYFAYQFPVRTVVLGNDIYDNSIDNEHKIHIYSTMGGAYGGRDAYVDIAVDESLCDNLWFVGDGGNPESPVLPMPSNYYNLSSNVIPYNGDQRGYVEVQLTDAFFNDPKSVGETYVIPLLMKGVRGIDHILTGTPRNDIDFIPARTNTDYWRVLAKDYVLYCVKYKNPWDAKYIRRGVDNVTEKGVATKVVRKDFSLVNSDLEHYKENPVNQNDEICGITTKNMTQAIFPVSFNIGEDAHGNRPSQKCSLLLTFSGDNCTITSEDEDVPSTGSGEFIEKGSGRPEFKDYQWQGVGKADERDILRLSYNVTFKKGRVIGKYTVKEGGKEVEKDWILEDDITISTTDTLVVQTREANKKVFFSPKYVK